MREPTDFGDVVAGFLNYLSGQADISLGDSHGHAEGQQAATRVGAMLEHPLSLRVPRVRPCRPSSCLQGASRRGHLQPGAGAAGDQPRRSPESERLPGAGVIPSRRPRELLLNSAGNTRLARPRRPDQQNDRARIVDDDLLD